MSTAEPRLARIAAAIADPTRARMLARLLDGRLHTAGELATHAGVTAPTMSAHLKLLVDEGLARVRPQGRHRYFGLAGELGVQWREALLARGWVTATPDGRYELSDAGHEALAELMPEGFAAAGRPLYDCVDWSERRDHFAGPLAVVWLEAMVEKGWLRRVPGSREMRLAPDRPSLVEALMGGMRFHGA